MEIIVDTSVLIAVLTGEPTRDHLIARTQGAELLAPARLGRAAAEAGVELMEVSG